MIDQRKADQFRRMADALQEKIEYLSRPLSHNPTPKRNREYQSRLHTARNFERTQRALRALADGHEAGILFPHLAALKTKEEIARLVQKYSDSSKGYYSCVECPTTPTQRPRVDCFKR